ncbi:MAG: OmpW family protein [Ideonella sp.]|nr:OmpW family protein [Ideonella sp.]MBL0149732.1 OmpW family protein [Ideonella sp.]
MNKTWLIAIAAAAAIPAVQAQDTGNWIVRARAVNLDSANKDSTGLGLTINNKVIPEVDISYFFSPNVAAELILTYPQKQTVYSKGSEIGSFKHLPPTLNFQYHVTGLGGFRPYVGAGLNYTNLTAVHFAPAVVTALHPGLKHNSFGLSVQAGVDIPMGGGWLLNADVKKVQIETTVYSSGASAGKFKVDPTLFALGFGKRF